MADVVRFTELLFADQSLDELLASRNRDELPEDLWKRLAEVAGCLRRNELGQAVELLLAIAANPTTATRVLLWSWTTLRGLGVQPKSAEADEIKGTVIEVPMDKGADVLAAYADGTARYVNHSGKVVIWDLPDAQIGSLIRTVLVESRNLVTGEATALNQQRGDNAVRVTVLTLSGNRFAEVAMGSLRTSPINRVLTVGAELMGSLIKRTEAMNRLLQQLPGSPRRS